MPPSDLVDFQQAFSAHLRAPQSEACPNGIPQRRSQVYEELLFKNIQGFVDKCFPVAKSIINQDQWLHLTRLFFQNWQSHTPYFSRIPFEFVQFIRSKPTICDIDQPLSLPAWFDSLLHYEWAELEVDLFDAVVPRVHTPLTENYKLKVNPTLQNLEYNWPVHRISANNLPSSPIETRLLVYRSFDHQVLFMEVNALTAALVHIFETETPPKEALNQLVQLVPNMNPEQVLQFGQSLIEDLLKRNALTLSN